MGLRYSRPFRLLSRLVQVKVLPSKVRDRFHCCWYRYRSARLNVANG